MSTTYWPLIILGIGIIEGALLLISLLINKKTYNSKKIIYPLKSLFIIFGILNISIFCLFYSEGLSERYITPFYYLLLSGIFQVIFQFNKPIDMIFKNIENYNVWKIGNLIAVGLFWFFLLRILG